jgi:hypothetical protein
MKTNTKIEIVNNATQYVNNVVASTVEHLSIITRDLPNNEKIIEQQAELRKAVENYERVLFEYIRAEIKKQ